MARDGAGGGGVPERVGRAVRPAVGAVRAPRRRRRRARSAARRPPARAPRRRARPPSAAGLPLHITIQLA